MHNPSEIIHRWLCSHRTDETPHVRAAYAQLDRYDQAERQSWMDWSLEDLTRFCAIVDQQRLEFAEEDSRDNARKAVARYIEMTVAPACADPDVRKLPARLREARQTGTIMYRKQDQKFITMWDQKAGLPLLCPDDAREEAMRVQRRVVPAVMKALEQKGARAYSCVFTQPNDAPGQLRAGMRRLSKRFNAFIRKCKRDQSLPILGAYAVMEAPLGGYRTWHPHLNVILITSGWFDYAKLRELWRCNVHVERLVGSQDSIEAALRELIKYSVRSVPEKSHAKAHSGFDQLGSAGPGLGAGVRRTGNDHADASQAPPDPGQAARTADRPAAPALIEWTAAEFLEWWRAHKRFRRSRGYGVLFRIAKPEKESLDGFEATGTVTRESGRLIRRLHLLESIPGDKSTTPDARERLRRHLRRLTGDPNEHRKALLVMQEAMAAWQTIQKPTH